MYQVKIVRFQSAHVVLGPTETRDEASRLARAWLDAHAGTIAAARFDPVTRVIIRRVDDEQDEEG
jgi:hypothetical protein